MPLKIKQDAQICIVWTLCSHISLTHKHSWARHCQCKGLNNSCNSHNSAFVLRTVDLSTDAFVQSQTMECTINENTDLSLPYSAEPSILNGGVADLQYGTDFHYAQTLLDISCNLLIQSKINSLISMNWWNCIEFLMLLEPVQFPV